MTPGVSVTVDPDRLQEALVAVAEVNSQQVVFDLDTTGEDPECTLWATDGAQVMFVEIPLTITGDYTDDVDRRVAVDFELPLSDDDWFQQSTFDKMLDMVSYHGEKWTISITDADESEQYDADAVRFFEENGWVFAFEQHAWVPDNVDTSEFDLTQTIVGKPHVARGGLFGIASTAERAEGRGEEVTVRTFDNTDRAVVEAVTDAPNPPRMRIGSRTDDSEKEAFGKRYAASFIESVVTAAPDCDEWVIRCGPNMPLVAETGAATWAIAPRIVTNRGDKQ